MAAKKKLSYEQEMALHYGRQVARQNQKRAVAARRASAEADAAREEQDAAQQARLRELRGGFDVGDRVSGRCVFFGARHAGVVLDGGSDGVRLLDDDGVEWLVSRVSLKAEEV